MKNKPVLDLVDGLLSSHPHLAPYSRLNESGRLHSVSSYSGTSKDIQLQSLDARALLVGTSASTPGSSLDLEWEHETVPLRAPSGSLWTEPLGDVTNSSLDHVNDVACGGCNSDSDWSRVSSATSLEWDNVQSEIVAAPPSPTGSDFDNDTLMLLSEIERLTSKTLSETGRELFS